MRSPSRQAQASAAPGPAPLKRRVVDFKQRLEEALENGPPGLARAAFRGLERLRLAIKSAPAAMPADAPPGSAPMPGEAKYPVTRGLADSAMPALARRIIEAQDPVAVARQRRAHFGRYAEGLRSLEGLTLLHDTLPPRACPWVFPVLLDGRDEIDHVWRAQGVALHTFGIYLHSRLFDGTDTATVDDARYLASHLLCLAIHQDLSAQQIGRAVDIMQSSLERG